MPSPAPAQLDSRRFTRIAFRARVALNVRGETHECRLVDISFNGALVEATSPWTARRGDPCALLAKLAEGGEIIRMIGEVAHATPQRLGVHCRELDLDSITNLRRIVELNAGDPRLLQRDLATLVAENPAA